MLEYEYILILGSNLGDRNLHLKRAIHEIRKCDLHIKSLTKTSETPPYLIKTQDLFFNRGILIETNLSPLDVLQAIKKIEIKLGRLKIYRYGPRNIDIDIVWWSEGAYLSDRLCIPHIHNRSRPWVRDCIAELIPLAIDSASGIKYTDLALIDLRTISDFRRKKDKQEKITILTCYDYTMANLLSRTSLDAVLVGDSLSGVIQGKGNTINVSLRDMIYHARCVRKGLPDIFMVVDMPFMSYKISREQTLKNASKIIKETGCDALKVEGASQHLPFIESIIDAGIPVMGHLGLEPQMFLREGSHKLQLQREEEHVKLIEDAKKLENIGCFSIVLEMVPESLGKKLSSSLKIPIIGIGAGAHTDGQVLVIQDLLGMNPDFNPRFCRKYLHLAEEISQAIEEFCLDVRQSSFPSTEESFK